MKLMTGTFASGIFGVVAAMTAACSSAPSKEPVADEAAALTAPLFRYVGSLDTNGPTRPFGFAPTPTATYAAFKFAGHVGDAVDVKVRSRNGDAVAFVLDNDWKLLASNDDADATTTDAHVTLTLPRNASNTHYLLVREYYRAPATFTVDFQIKHDVFACDVDSECVAVKPATNCCNNGLKVAVRAGDEAAYATQNACATGLVCSQIFRIETRVPACNGVTHACEMKEPVAACAPNTKMCLTYQHFDGTACACVDNPHCGGIGGIRCPADYATCADDPRDTCDPTGSGRDCGGLCVH